MESSTVLISYFLFYTSQESDEVQIRRGDGFRGTGNDFVRNDSRSVCQRFHNTRRQQGGVREPVSWKKVNWNACQTFFVFLRSEDLA